MNPRQKGLKSPPCSFLQGAVFEAHHRTSVMITMLQHIYRGNTSSWWFFPTHLKNMRKSNWIMKPQIGMNIKKYLKPPPRHACVLTIPSRELTHPRPWESRKIIDSKVPAGRGICDRSQEGISTKLTKPHMYFLQKKNNTAFEPRCLPNQSLGFHGFATSSNWVECWSALDAAWHPLMQLTLGES